MWAVPEQGVSVLTSWLCFPLLSMQQSARLQGFYTSVVLRRKSRYLSLVHTFTAEYKPAELNTTMGDVPPSSREKVFFLEPAVALLNMWPTFFFVERHVQDNAWVFILW